LASDLFAFGSGAVQLSCQAIGLHAIADGAVWRSIPPLCDPPPRLAPLTPLHLAAKRGKARLEVVLGGVDIELNALMDLRHGDVLRLPLRLDERVSVHSGKRVLAEAQLGEVHGRKGVQVFSLQPVEPRRKVR
jgi:hypothetical protein